MNTTPGTSVTTDSFCRRLARRAAWSSNQPSSSAASTVETIVVINARPTAIASAVPKSRTVMPGSASSTSPTISASIKIAPMPSVSTDSGTTIEASAGHTTALSTPTTNPASRASGARSISKPGRIAARNHSETAVNTTTTALRHSTRLGGGRSLGRTHQMAVVVSHR